MEMKTPWWWATSVHGVGVWMSMAKRPLQLLASGKSGESKPSTRTPAPEPRPGGPQAGSAVSEQPSLHSVKK